jgi:DNA-directed RNA polymerase specialized sigma24 family protein/CheY-like chemotaxis protein
MSLSKLIAQYLPFLRRYSRALTGSQKSGDAYVASVLEALIEEPQHFPGEYEPRIALYRAFTKVWNSVAERGFSDPDAQKLPVERKLAQLMPRTRQAFLLVGLEGFSEKDAAKILDTDVPGLQKLLDDAGRDLAAEIATNVLIIEDVPLIAADIEGLVENLGHKVVGIAQTHKEAIKIAKAKLPGLILADIKLADGSSGLDAVNEILQTFEVPVIFITAYPERFLTGERPEPAFLIPKPFQPATVSAVISQALFFERAAKRREKRAS